MSSLTNVDENQIQLARSLADPLKSIRDNTVDSLSKYLSTLTTMTDLECLKLWKALHYCMWLCDKTQIQEELALKFSKLFYHIKKYKLKLLFNKMFYRTMLREWASLDSHRVNKFYMLIRVMLNELFVFYKKKNYKQSIVISLSNILYDEIITKIPNGIRFHITDIYLEELLKSTNGDITSVNFILCINIFLRTIKNTREQVLVDRITNSFFAKYLNKYASENSETQENVFFKVDTKWIQKLVFDIASSEDIPEVNRKKCYSTHKLFHKVTGEEFVNDEHDKYYNPLEVKKIEDEDEKIDEIDSKKVKDKKRKINDEIEDLESKKTKNEVIEVIIEESSSEIPQNDISGGQESNIIKTVILTTETNENPEFIPSKVYNGTKIGYIFQKGPLGLGYYLDSPPVKVDLKSIIKSKKSNKSVKFGKKDIKYFKK